VPEEQLHELRVAGKQMRYLGDAFRSFYKGRQVRKFHEHLTALQDCLGALNDAFVAERLMAELAAQLPVAELDPAEIAHLRGLIAGWQAGRIDTGVQHFSEQWRDFRKADAYWKHD